jgi:hypothetical protein
MVIAQKLTDPMNNISDKDIRPGSYTCPSCNSSVWKRAREVVMEGTTNAFTATANNCSNLRGGVRDSLLSDRWFTWDYPIEADVGLSSSTGLIQDVKRFMVEYGPAVQMPSRPPEPNLTTSIRSMRKGMQQTSLLAQAPTEPVPSELMETTVKSKETRKCTVKTGLARFLLIMVAPMAGLIGASAFFGNESLAVLPVFILVPLIMIIATFKARNRKARIAADGNVPEPFEQYTKERERFQEEAERFRIRHEQSERKLSEYKIMLEEETKAEEATAIYKQQLAEYESKKIYVLKARELLWERTRLCMRCGTAYLGPD